MNLHVGSPYGVVINFLYRKVEYINGLGSFEDPQTVRVRDKAGKEVSSVCVCVCGVAIESEGGGVLLCKLAIF